MAERLTKDKLNWHLDRSVSTVEQVFDLAEIGINSIKRSTSLQENEEAKYILNKDYSDLIEGNLSREKYITYASRGAKIIIQLFTENKKDIKDFTDAAELRITHLLDEE